jgi:hypothetical protein
MELIDFLEIFRESYRFPERARDFYRIREISVDSGRF